MRLAASAWGDPLAPQVCFFHGGGQSRRSWSGAARHVAAAGYRAIAIDLRGHGESGWAPDGDYLLDAYARDIVRLIDALPRPVALVGASRGGQAAFCAASRRPTRVPLVMLADVAPQMDETYVGGIRSFLHASLPGFVSLDAAADALAHHLGRPRIADPSRLRHAMREENARLYWTWDPRMVSVEAFVPPSEAETMIAAAEIISVPVVLIRAEFGSLVDDASVAHFRRLVSQLIVEQAPGTRHMFTGDDNAAFAARLLRHLKATAR